MNFKTNSTRRFPLAFAAVAALSFGMAEPAFAQATIGENVKAALNSPCTVTAGDNKGRTGTYTIFAGRLVCVAGSSGTLCKPGYCKDAGKAATTEPSMVPSAPVFASPKFEPRR
ncbi:hypothetical protein GCM10027034_30270 [Ramlibacter solisilvae]|uniref:TrbC/VirB2 family protein n=1 Tax=Ramlibacter tataouinensis TaxID=94132 RepID=UPI0011AE9034|nr:TrbC/VirB2 family protein [Ramlibacter tataouinensis]